MERNEKEREGCTFVNPSLHFFILILSILITHKLKENIHLNIFLYNIKDRDRIILFKLVLNWCLIKVCLVLLFKSVFRAKITFKTINNVKQITFEVKSIFQRHF